MTDSEKPETAVNDPRTQVAADTSLTHAVHDLIALRNRYGHNTAIGHRATNTLEQLENYPPDWIDYLEPDGVKEQRRNLNKSISRSLAELSKLTAA